MEQRSLDITIISAKDISNVNFITKMDVYAVVFISGDGSKKTFKTPVDKDGGSSPTWNFTVKLTIDEAAAQQNGISLVLKLKSERVLGDKEIGEVRVPVKELLDSPGSVNGKQFVSYQVRKPDGKPKGFITFSYQFGEKAVKVDEPVMAYPPPTGMVGTSSYPPQQKCEVYPPPHAHGAPVAGYAPPPPQYAGYGYPPQQGYEGGYPSGTSSYPPQQKWEVYPPPHAHGAPVAGYAPPPPQYAGYGYPPKQGYQGGYPPQHGYGYPSQHGYGYPPVVQPHKKKKNEMGMGLGAGLLGGALGGMLLGDMVSDAAAYDAGYDAGFDDAGFDF